MFFYSNKYNTFFKYCYKRNIKFYVFFLKSSLLYPKLLYKQNLVLYIYIFDIANFQGIIWLYIWMSTITLDI